MPGSIGDEPEHSGTPQPWRPSGLPQGRAPSLLCLLGVLPARLPRPVSNPSRPWEQRAERPPGARLPHARQATEATAGVALHYVEDGRASITKQAQAYPALPPILGERCGLSTPSSQSNIRCS